MTILFLRDFLCPLAVRYFYALLPLDVDALPVGSGLRSFARGARAGPIDRDSFLSPPLFGVPRGLLIEQSSGLIAHEPCEAGGIIDRGKSPAFCGEAIEFDFVDRRRDRAMFPARHDGATQPARRRSE